MKKNLVIFCAFLIAGIAIYRCHQLSEKLSVIEKQRIVLTTMGIQYDTPHATPSSTHEMYQLWIDGNFYVLKDGDRQVWKGKAGGNDQIDQIVIEDNL